MRDLKIGPTAKHKLREYLAHLAKLVAQGPRTDPSGGHMLAVLGHAAFVEILHDNERETGYLAMVEALDAELAPPAPALRIPAMGTAGWRM